MPYYYSIRLNMVTVFVHDHVCLITHCLGAPGFDVCCRRETYSRREEPRGAQPSKPDLPDVAGHFHIQENIKKISLKSRPCGVAVAASRAGLPLRGSGPDNVWQWHGKTRRDDACGQAGRYVDLYRGVCRLITYR